MNQSANRFPSCSLCMIVSLLFSSASLADEVDNLFRDRVQQPSFTSHRESSSNEDLNRNGDARGIKKGETLVLADVDGPGAITHIWFTVGSYDPFHGRSLVLRAYWDGSEKPSVQAPLGDFFGVGHGAFSSFVSQPVCVNSEGRSRSCFWRMPFKKHARITVTNDSEKYDCDSLYYYVDWQKYESLPEDTTYFCAQYRQAMPAQPGDYVILDTTGKGQYVGTVYSVQQVENGWFGEGDDRFWIDGEATPSLRGTGTEDYFNDAWGFRQFSTPYYGVSLWEGYFAGDRVTAYRWHIPDPVAFSKSLKVTIEHRGSVFTDDIAQLGSFVERPDWISSVAFWYQSPPAELDPALPPASARIAPYRVIPASSLKVRGNPTVAVVKQEDGVSYLPLGTDASIEFDFDVTEAGRYVVSAFMQHAFVGGVYQPFMDGKPFGAPIDLCVPGADILPVRLDQHVLEPGTHTLKFECKGPSPTRRTLAKPACSFGMTYLVLLRLEDMQGFHEAQKKIFEEQAASGK